MMRRILTFLAVLLCAASVRAAEGPNGAYVKTDYVLFPIPASVNPMVVTDANGYLVVKNNTQTAPLGPARPMSNTPLTTDSSNYLMVACSGCTPATTANLQIASLGLGTAASTTTGTITSTAPFLIFPSTDTTTAVQFTKADGTTSVLTMDTTNKYLITGGSVGIGGQTPSSASTLIGASGGVALGGNSGAWSFGINGSTGDTVLASSDKFGWASGNITSVAPAPDTYLGRSAAGKISQMGVAQILSVASNFTTAANTNLQTITGLTVALPINLALNVPFQCKLIWSQATAAVAVSFGVQSDTVTPTNLMALGQMETNLTVTSYGDITAVASTTAQTVVTGTPAAVATTYNAYIDGYLENPSNISVTNLNIMVKTATAADAVTVYRGSFCRLF